MRIKFWGTRGSFAKPGPTTLRYGGNTSCVELRTDGGTLIVIDCGTGGTLLGQHLIADNRGLVNAHMLISHTHWDHIQGIPFFTPFRDAGSVWDIYGPKGLSQSLRATLAGQMDHTYFPSTLSQVVQGALKAGDNVLVGGTEKAAPGSKIIAQPYQAPAPSPAPAAAK